MVNIKSSKKDYVIQAWEVNNFLDPWALSQGAEGLRMMIYALKQEKYKWRQRNKF